MIEASDIAGASELTALRVIAFAQTVAPCLQSLEGDQRALAVAVLTGVALELEQRGSRLIRDQGIGPARVGFVSAESVFTEDDKAALRALCGSVALPGAPVGHFPAAGVVRRVWGEEER